MLKNWSSFKVKCAKGFQFFVSIMRPIPKPPKEWKERQKKRKNSSKIIAQKVHNQIVRQPTVKAQKSQKYTCKTDVDMQIIREEKDSKSITSMSSCEILSNQSNHSLSFCMGSEYSFYSSLKEEFSLRKFRKQKNSEKCRHLQALTWSCTDLQNLDTQNQIYHFSYFEPQNDYSKKYTTSSKFIENSVDKKSWKDSSRLSITDLSSLAKEHKKLKIRSRVNTVASSFNLSDCSYQTTCNITKELSRFGSLSSSNKSLYFATNLSSTNISLSNFCDTKDQAEIIKLQKKIIKTAFSGSVENDQQKQKAVSNATKLWKKKMVTSKNVDFAKNSMLKMLRAAQAKQQGHSSFGGLQQFFNTIEGDFDDEDGSSTGDDDMDDFDDNEHDDDNDLDDNFDDKNRDPDDLDADADDGPAGDDNENDEEGDTDAEEDLIDDNNKFITNIGDFEIANDFDEDVAELDEVDQQAYMSFAEIEDDEDINNDNDVSGVDQYDYILEAGGLGANGNDNENADDAIEDYGGLIIGRNGGGEDEDDLANIDYDHDHLGYDMADLDDQDDNDNFDNNIDMMDMEGYEDLADGNDDFDQYEDNDDLKSGDEEDFFGF